MAHTDTWEEWNAKLEAAMVRQGQGCVVVIANVTEEMAKREKERQQEEATV